MIRGQLLTLVRGWGLAMLATGSLGAASAADQPPPFKPVPATPAKGRIEHILVHGRSLEGNLGGESADRKVAVYLPPSYDQAPRRRYPVLYLLHAFSALGNGLEETYYGLRGQPSPLLVPWAAERAFARGVPEMIIVTPNAVTRFGGSMYSSSPTIGDWETFIASDLVEHIDRHYRTLARVESRGLAGHSMGGYGALRLALKRPGVYAAVYSMSPCCLATPPMPPAALPGQVAAVGRVDGLRAADITPSSPLAGAAAWTPEPALSLPARVGPLSLLAQAAAWSPDSGKPPLYLDLPAMDGQPVPGIWALWVANSPLWMIPQYLPALRGYRGLAIDVGDRDQFGGIPDSVRALDAALRRYGVPHSAEMYAGDHADQIDSRFSENVLPFFARHLLLQ